MREEHGQRVPCDPKQVTRDEVPIPPLPLPPPSGQAGQTPTTPLQRTHPSPKQTTHLGPASEKPHFGLQIWIRGRSSDTRWPWRAFLAKQHFSTRSGSRASDSRWMTSALPSRATFARYLRAEWKIHGRPVPQDRSMAGRYGTGVYIRNPLVPSHHSARKLGGDHISRHIEKKHYQRDQRKNRLLWRTCRPNS